MSGNAESALVLVADDDQRVRAFVATVLRSRGLRAVETADGLDALRWAAEYRGRIHLLITDCAMPRMDGPELAERLGALHPETRILFITGGTETMISAERVLKKPFGVRDLLGRVATLLPDNAAATRI